ncbi:MAG: TIGR00159 family protein [Anaerolineae bacterium]|nr:TIGR00159 family protein [Anaerolineae bacterium]
MANMISEILFLIQRFNWLSLLDIFLVSAIFYIILSSLKNTQAQTLMRGVIILIVLIAMLTTLVNLPAFSWLIKNTLPALLFAIPVIFMPELRRALERLGSGRPISFLQKSTQTDLEVVQRMIKAVVSAASRLAVFRQGALIVLQRRDSLREYEDTGVKMGAQVTPELLLQIFYPNTPLHDGAAILVGDRITAAACVMPLSASGVLNSSPERQMGLRHRAALGISEASDAIAVVVSEETGSISLAHRGRILRRISADKLENVLMAFYQQQAEAREKDVIRHFFESIFKDHKEGKA